MVEVLWQRSVPYVDENPPGYLAIHLGHEWTIDWHQII